MKLIQPCDVSVIITVYNQNAALDLLLSLLAKQDYLGRWEVLVCDDGSNEDTLSIVRAAARGSKRRIRYVWQSRDGFGLARSRNNALRCADGSLIIFMDADLAVAPDFVSQHARCHSDGRRRLVCGTRKWLFLDDLPRGIDLASFVPRLLSSKSSMSALSSELHFQKEHADTPRPWFSCRGCNFSFLRDDQLYLFDESFNGWGGEDTEFACRLHSRHGYEITLEPDICGLHLEEGRRRFLGVRPKSHPQIVQFLRNMVYLNDSYPEFDMSPAFDGFGFFELDVASNHWRLASNPKFSHEHLHSVVTTAQRWLTDAGLR